MYSQKSSNKPWKYSARINSFKTNGVLKTGEIIEKISKIQNVWGVDLNYPQHFKSETTSEIIKILKDNEMNVNSISMRYNIPQFDKGALTHPNKLTRQKSIDLTLRAIDIANKMDCNLITLWLSQEGWNSSFSPANYKHKYDLLIQSLEQIVAGTKNVNFSIEYKPRDPFNYLLVNNLKTSLQIISDLNYSNLGVTIDFSHALMANENPANSVYKTDTNSKLLGVHLNDCYDKDDDGLATASIHKKETREFIKALIDIQYKSPIYFDTFPATNPEKELLLNITRVENILKNLNR